MSRKPLAHYVVHFSRNANANLIIILFLFFRIWISWKLRSVISTAIRLIYRPSFIPSLNRPFIINHAHFRTIFTYQRSEKSKLASLLLHTSRCAGCIIIGIVGLSLSVHRVIPVVSQFLPFPFSNLPLGLCTRVWGVGRKGRRPVAATTTGFIATVGTVVRGSILLHLLLTK